MAAVAPVEPMIRTPATTPVGIDADAIVAAASEEDRQAVETLCIHVEARARQRDPWRDVLGQVLDRRAVQHRLELRAVEEVDTLVQAGRLLALPTRGGEAIYPAFQFMADGQPFPAIGAVIDVLGPVVASPYTIASWLTNARSSLDGESPIGWLAQRRDPQRVIEEARLTAAALAR